MNRILPPAAAATKLGTGGVPASTESQSIFSVNDLNVFYGDFHAVKDVSVEVTENEITAFIGP